MKTLFRDVADPNGPAGLRSRLAAGQRRTTILGFADLAFMASTARHDNNAVLVVHVFSATSTPVA